MIYTFIADFSSLDFDKAIAKQESLFDCKNDFYEDGEIRLCPAALERICSTGSEKLRKERLAAYLLASYAVRQTTGKTAEIFWKENKIPVLINAPYQISISHASSVVCFSMSDEGAVGVDVEEEISEDRADRLEKRYFSKMNISFEPKEVSYSFFTFSSCGEITSKEVLFLPVTDFGFFTAKWCTYEALIKQGSVFQNDSLNCNLYAKADIKEVDVNGKKYYISTVCS